MPRMGSKGGQGPSLRASVDAGGPSPSSNSLQSAGPQPGVSRGCDLSQAVGSLAVPWTGLRAATGQKWGVSA